MMPIQFSQFHLGSVYLLLEFPYQRLRLLGTCEETDIVLVCGYLAFQLTELLQQTLSFLTCRTRLYPTVRLRCTAFASSHSEIRELIGHGCPVLFRNLLFLLKRNKAHRIPSFSELSRSPVVRIDVSSIHICFNLLDDSLLCTKIIHVLRIHASVILLFVVKEMITRRTESGPDLVRLLSGNRTDFLPLLLERYQIVGAISDSRSSSSSQYCPAQPQPARRERSSSPYYRSSAP